MQHGLCCGLVSGAYCGLAPGWMVNVITSISWLFGRAFPLNLPLPKQRSYKRFMRSDSGSVVESALVSIPFLMILFSFVWLSQIFNALGTVSLDSVAINMEALTRINDSGTVASFQASDLFVGHDPALVNEALSNSDMTMLNRPIPLQIANSLAGRAHARDFAFGISNHDGSSGDNANQVALRFIQVLDSNSAPEYADSALVVTDYQPTLLKLIATRSVFSSVWLNPIVPKTEDIITTISIEPYHSGSILPPNPNTNISLHP